MNPNNTFGIDPALWRKIQSLRLLDDLLMQTAMDDFVPGVELILRIILNKPDLEVRELTVQKVLPRMGQRELRLDIKAVDAEGKHYNIEVQRSDSGAMPRRPRYHSALMDVQYLKKGMQPSELPETYVIFITENDCLGGGLPVYHIEHVITETGKPFGDDAHIVYANAAYVGDDAFGHLMSDFRERDPDKMYYRVLAEHIREVKSGQKGVTEMSRVLEETFEEGREEGMHIGSARLLFQMMRRRGMTLEEVLEFAGLPAEQKPAYEAHIKELEAQTACL